MRGCEGLGGVPGAPHGSRGADGGGLFMLLAPAGLYWRIWHMDLVQSAVLYGVMTLISTYLVAFAYKNVKFVLKHK